jgi:alpha-D-xyloside xylohydrolase
MPSFFSKNQNRLVYHYDAETLWVEPWGQNSLRVRGVKNAEMPYTSGVTKTDWALLPQESCAQDSCEASITINDEGAVIRNGKIEIGRAHV